MSTYDMTNNAILSAVKDYHVHHNAASEKINECENIINSKGDELAISHALAHNRLKKAPSGHLYIQLKH